MARLSSRSAAHWVDHLLGHWVWVAAMILVAAALTIPQIEKYPLSLDAIDSYAFAFGLQEDPYTTSDMLGHLYSEIPDQTALFYILLQFWGKLTGHSIAATRLISLFCGLLSLAMIYRLARDTVSPVAGLFAAVLLLGNAFYAFYYAQARYYTLVVLLTTFILWLYLRLANQHYAPKRRDYLALTLACFALVSTHAFSFLLYIVLSLYHLLAVKKNRRWVELIAAALGGLLLAVPQLAILLSVGVERAQGMHRGASADMSAVLTTWIIIVTNSSPVLLVIVVGGCLIGLRKQLLPGNPFLLLFPLLAISIGVASVATGVVSEGQMRYMLVGTPIVMGFIAAGLYALYRLRRWLGLLTLLFLVAGLSFMRTADWEDYIQARTWAYTHPPWHLISRWMQQSGEKLPAMTFGVSHNALRKYTFVPAHLLTYYFGQYGVEVSKLAPEAIADFVAPNAVQQPGYWTLYQSANTEPATLAAIDILMQDHNYVPCGTTHFPNATVLVTYRWTSLACQTQPTAIHSTAIGEYLAYGAIPGHTGGRLLISGAWQANTTAGDAAYNLSYQLLDDQRRNVAQLDLNLNQMSELRQFELDIAELPAGNYALFAIVYHAQTGERQAWQGNESWIPEMQQLAEITIPEQAATSS
ncbi:MAG: glycosyltransferase family 39 protein [Chloroflexi bacterium]|nr:glycosyltransferase family 39 protein [Chloroflexota bacterium]